jgi:tight adherence protein C
MISLPLIIIIAVVLIGIIIVAVMLMGGGRSEEQIAERLAQFAERPLTLEEIELQKPFGERVLAPLMTGISTRLGKMMPKQTMDRLRTKLETAGSPMQPGAFMVLQVVSVVISTVLAIVLLQNIEDDLRILYMVGLALVGIVLPQQWLTGRVKSRQKSILKSLPDAIDLLTISVEAGLGFDLAMQRVVEKWDNELSREFSRVLADTRLGKNRRDALRELTGRTGVADLSTFVAAVIQADQLGVSIAKILRVQSDQLRIRRRQRAEELAHQAPIKMLFPLVFLIFPAMFVVILGPAVPMIWDAFMGGGVPGG